MNNPYNEFSIQMYIGEKRSGKTLSATAQVYEMIKNYDTKVYANYKLNPDFFPNFQFITKKDLEGFYENKEDFKKCIFILDETHILLDSRRFAKEGNLKIGYLLGQMGKRGNILIANTHFPRLVDFRLRSYCERWIYVAKVFYINGKIVPIMNYNKELTDKENSKLYIYCEPIIRKLVNFEFQYIKETPYLLKAEKYFNLYDNEEMIT